MCVQATGTRRLIGVLAFSGPSILVIEQIVANISRFRIYLFEEARILRGLFKKHILYGVFYLLILAAVHKGSRSSSYCLASTLTITFRRIAQKKK